VIYVVANWSTGQLGTGQLGTLTIKKKRPRLQQETKSFFQLFNIEGKVFLPSTFYSLLLLNLSPLFLLEHFNTTNKCGMKQKVVLAVGGSSGSIYAKVLMDTLVDLQDQWEEVGVVMSSNARFNWEYELGDREFENYPFSFYEKNDFMAPFASGSARFGVMIVCPCSMGVMGRIASGVSTDLTTRAADVILKERRRLILIPRDTPYNLIHINNMKLLTEAGAIICPATPSFYSRPESFEQLARTVTDRVLDLAGFNLDSYRWGQQA
jgi:4-hydroxy-3-polyprenylbenzoate decarboxylase